MEERNILDEIIAYIEEKENDTIENIIKVIYKRFNENRFFLETSFKEMLGVGYYSFVKYGIEHNLFDTEIEVPQNLLFYNPNFVDSGLDINNNYEMFLLSLYFYFASFDSVQMSINITDENNILYIGMDRYMYCEDEPIYFSKLAKLKGDIQITAFNYIAKPENYNSNEVVNKIYRILKSVWQMEDIENYKKVEFFSENIQYITQVYYKSLKYCNKEEKEYNRGTIADILKKIAKDNPNCCPTAFFDFIKNQFDKIEFVKVDNQEFQNENLDNFYFYMDKLYLTNSSSTNKIELKVSSTRYKNLKNASVTISIKDFLKFDFRDATIYLWGDETNINIFYIPFLEIVKKAIEKHGYYLMDLTIREITNKDKKIIKAIIKSIIKEDFEMSENQFQEFKEAIIFHFKTDEKYRLFQII